MGNTLGLAMFSAAAIAFASAGLGVGMARLFWADDLRHARELRIIWGKQQASWQRQREAMEGTIEIQQQHINTLKHRSGLSVNQLNKAIDKAIADGWNPQPSQEAER